MRILFIILLFTLLLTAQLGAAHIPFAAWHCTIPDCQGGAYILWNIRLPRAIAALVIGAMLAISGAAMQGIFRNPLIDPSIIGVTSGASLAAALYLVVIAPHLTTVTPYTLPIAAIIGSWLAAMSLYRRS